MRNGEWLLPIIDATNQMPGWIGIVIAGFALMAIFKGADRADTKAGRSDPNAKSPASSSALFLILLIVVAVVGTRVYGG